MSETRWGCSLALSIGGNNGSGQSMIVDTVARAANTIGRINGFIYGEDFVVKQAQPDEIVFEFNTPEERDAAARNIVKKCGADPCPDCGEELIHQEGIRQCRNCGFEDPTG